MIDFILGASLAFNIFLLFGWYQAGEQVDILEGILFEQKEADARPEAKE